jgi:two-component system cell cycle sensor histidine kinase/response regulator CckA
MKTLKRMIQNVVANATPTSPPQGQGELILIVDDEEPVRSLVKRILEANRYRTLVATNGTEAIALYTGQAHQINLVLTDLNMPSMPGREIIAVLRKLNPEVKIIVLTGADPVSELGAHAIIKKPFAVAALLDTLRKVLHTTVS